MCNEVPRQKKGGDVPKPYRGRAAESSNATNQNSDKWDVHEPPRLRIETRSHMPERETSEKGTCMNYHTCAKKEAFGCAMMRIRRKAKKYRTRDLPKTFRFSAES